MKFFNKFYTKTCIIMRLKSLERKSIRIHIHVLLQKIFICRSRLFLNSRSSFQIFQCLKIRSKFTLVTLEFFGSSETFRKICPKDFLPNFFALRSLLLVDTKLTHLDIFRNFISTRFPAFSRLFRVKRANIQKIFC